MSFRQAAAKLCKRLRNSDQLWTNTYRSLPNADKFGGVKTTTLFSDALSLWCIGQKGNLEVSGEYKFRDHAWSKHQRETFQWVFLSAQAAIIFGMNSIPSMCEDVSVEKSSNNVTSGTDIFDLRKIEDVSVVSNEHTSKWRVFTDNGRDFFMQGNLAQAEKFFLSALQEAKEGFGERDPHVASACNNLAELYRVKKAFDKAEPLYLEAINILEVYFGNDDVRVGAALHNLGQFYLVQRQLEKARLCYERALKIKRRVLGESHTDYADTMYHLGTVLYLQGEEKDSVDLIMDSIGILEAAGQGDSVLWARRMQYLAQIHTKSNRYSEAEILLRKILHSMELLKGWKSLDTVVAAERLALSLQSQGRLQEAKELLERCLDARKILLPDEHIQNAANMLHIARVKMLVSKQLMTRNNAEAIAELDVAKDLLQRSIRVARNVLVRSVEKKGKNPPIEVQRSTLSAALTLLQSLNALGSLEIMKLDHSKSRENNPTEANAAVRQCMYTFKELGSRKLIADSPEVKGEYLSCLRHLLYLISNGMATETREAKDVKDEIQLLEDEVSKLVKPDKTQVVS